MGPRTHLLLTLAATTTLGLAGCAGVGGIFDGIQTRDIEFWVEKTDWEIHPGVTTTVWAFCAEGDGVEPVHGGACGVPGPTIHVNAGDMIRLTFRNTHTIPHTIHFHGWHAFAADMNGNALLGDAMVADPGETEVIEWVAEPAGTFIYHCHFETPTHMEMGMYGTFIVHDRDETHPDKEFVTVLDEWQVRDQDTYHGNMPAYNFFTINGKSFPLTQPLVADPGDHVRIHMVNAGYEFHAMHIHGYTPDSWEGVAGAAHAVPTDVREIAPGQSVVLDFDADRKGVWLLHDHVVPRVTAGSDGSGFGAYPRGMLTVLVVGDEYLQALQDIVPDLLAAAGTDVRHPDAGHDEPAGGTGPVGSASDGDDPATGGDADAAGGSETDASPGGAGPSALVRMKDFVFGTENLVVEPGTTVTWRNDDPAYHTVTFEDGSVDSGRIEAGEVWSYTFETTGEFPYYCEPHAYQDDDGSWQGMTAKVVVQ